MSVTVAVIAMGEMGSGVAGRLVERGARVRTSLEGRGAASAERAAAAGVEVVGDDRALVEGADFVLSIVPPVRAGELAERLLPCLRLAAEKPVYVDCNAIAPQTLDRIARPFLDEGLPFADAGIIGGPPAPSGYNPRIYASGELAHRLTRLNEFGLDVRPISTALGDASSLKMAYAGTTKGTQAVMIALLIGAARAGVGEVLAAEMADSLPGRLEAQMKNLPQVLRKAYRWDGEMEEIARFLAPETGGELMFRGAADLYRRLAEDFAVGPEAERMVLLDSFDSRKA